MSNFIVRVYYDEPGRSFEFITNDITIAWKEARKDLLNTTLVTITHNNKEIYKHAKPYKKPPVIIELQARYG